jgi:hypothetical protein
MIDERPDLETLMKNGRALGKQIGDASRAATPSPKAVTSSARCGFRVTRSSIPSTPASFPRTSRFFLPPIAA